MKNLLLAAILGLALFVAQSAAFAAPPGFYSSGSVVTPNAGYMPYSLTTPYATGPTTSGFNYYSSPYGYRTLNAYSYTPTVWGWSGYQTQRTYVKPYVNGPWHSVYWNPFLYTYQYGPGYLSSTYANTFGW